jgi:uncharacterized protein (DUF488 family)
MSTLSHPDGIIWTIGHSTRPLDAFIAVLGAHGIEAVVDVRRFPGSRRLPHFNEQPLAAGLERAGIAYRSLTALGGRRRPAPDSINTGWRHEAFRGYADHLATEEFADGLYELLTIAGGLRTAVMCAEMLWWQCHRRIIADVLVSLGYHVLHIQTEKAAEPHGLVAPARFADGALVYDGGQPSLLDA